MPSKTHYVCLFSCAVVRAIHLELTDSLTTKDLFLAFKRFYARRGLPTMIYSNNATKFKGSQQQLQKVYGPLSSSWKPIVPRAPWWGEWWEQLVRTLKASLKRDLGKTSLTRAELETTKFQNIMAAYGKCNGTCTNHHSIKLAFGCI